jgi:4a-hydroxytetrahydrobiopterin dehydratase
MPGQPLIERHCAPVPKGATPISTEKAQSLLKEIHGWELINGALLRKSLRCKDFKDAVSLIGRIMTVAESNDHHPDLHLTSYRHLSIELSTHSIGGLSDNDFILAAKLDRILAHSQSLG